MCPMIYIKFTINKQIKEYFISNITNVNTFSEKKQGLAFSDKKGDNNEAEVRTN